MKTKLIFFGVGLAAVLFLFWFAKTRQENEELQGQKSVHVLAQAGVDLAKKQLFEEAHQKFDLAARLIERVGFELAPGDLKTFPLFIHELKNHKETIFEALFDAFPENLRNRIETLPVGSALPSDLEEGVISAINVLLKDPGLPKKISAEDGSAFPERIQSLLADARKRRDSGALSKSEGLRNTAYIGRLCLTGVLPAFFPMPLTEVEMQINHAVAYATEGKFEKSNEALEGVLEKQAFYSKPYLILARNFENLKKPEEAVLVLEKASKITPNDVSVWTGLATLYRKTGKTELAKQAYEKALQLNPESGSAQLGLEAMERDVKKPLQPSAHYAEQNASKPNDVDTLSNWGMALFKENKVDESDSVVTKAMGLFPGDVYLLKLKARLEGTKRNFRGAVEHLQKARSLSKKPDREIFLLLGVTYYNQQLTEDAYDILNQGLTLFPNDPHLLLNLAKVCEVIPEKQNEAIGYYETFVTAYPQEATPELKARLESLKKVRS